MKKKNFFREHISFTIFAILALLIILIAIFAPIVTGGVSPSSGVLRDAFQGPSGAHWFGTDKLGRDVFTRVVFGARSSLVATFSVVILAFVVGTVMGLLAGYFGGWVDAVIMRISDMMIAFPGLVLAIAVAGILGSSVRNAIIAIALVTWPKYARLCRSLVLKIRHRDFVYAAQVTGSKNGYILRKYMFPNTVTTLIITATTDIGSMMLELAGLSFLGFGAQPPAAEWGLMLNEGRAYMQACPWLMIFPGLAIVVVVIVFNMLGDNLRDILDPRTE